jgi:hypothetical protein
MYMIRHKTETINCHAELGSLLSQKSQIRRTVIIHKKDILLIVASLSDVMWYVGYYCSG